MQGFYQVSEREKHFENTNYPNQSRCKAPPDWLRNTMARIVPSLQLAKTEDHSYTLHLTSYTLHLTGHSRIFLHRAFFTRHYSLPPRQQTRGWLVGNNDDDDDDDDDNYNNFTQLD